MRFFCNSHSAISTCDSLSKHTKHRPHQQPVKLTRFSYSELQSSTNDFSPRALLGKGSHGAVYRATVHNGAATVAVKKSTSSTVVETAENELQILSKLHSPRIVNLLGYALNSTNNNSLLLVVEYMPNGTLYNFLHTHPNPPSILRRVRTALQVAKAVRTLHKSTPPIMHRDIKSTNVLIDEKGNARLSDFGLAIRGHVEELRELSTPPAGTLGYLDPCYLAPRDLSTKSDVFSFGILLLEIISGRKAIDVEYSPPYIIEWALPLIKSGGVSSIVDRRIKGRVDLTVVREVCVLAVRCVRSTAEKRPNVGEIVECLKKVYRRVKLGRIHYYVWRSKMRWRVDKSQPLNDDVGGDGDDDDDEMDGGDDWVENESRGRKPRHGCRKSLSERNNKVSNVDVQGNDKIDEELTRGSRRTVRSKLRSKSIGSFREISKVGPETGGGEMVVIKRRAQVTVKIASTRLSKSRSMSVIYGGKNGVLRNNNTSNNNTVKNDDTKVKQLEVFPLLVTSKKVNNNNISKIKT